MNLSDDQPTLLFSPKIEGKFQEGVVPPFYISLNIHDKILHNAMHDSGASHNLMPKVVMERLGLEITRPYKDLYSFDSSRVKCLGLIKDLCVSLTQIPAKCMVMDVVVADVPPKYGMLISRSWGAKLQGTMQMDGSYATVPIFGQLRRLYRESQMKFLVSSLKKPKNSPLYSVHIDLDSFILYNDQSVGEPESGNESAKDITEPMNVNIMATLEEYDEENHGQSTQNETQIKQETQCIQPISHSPQTYPPREEQDNSKPSTDPTT